jgi:hypothetical protein
MPRDDFRSFERNGLRTAVPSTHHFSFIVMTHQLRLVVPYVGTDRRASSTKKERRRRYWLLEQRRVGGCDDEVPLILRDEDDDDDCFVLLRRSFHRRLAAPLDWWRTQERDAELTEMSTGECRAFGRSGLRKADMNITVYSFIVITFQHRGSSLAARDVLFLRRRRNGADDAGSSSSSAWAAATTALR